MNVAEYLTISVPSLRRRVREGSGPHVRIGRRVLFPVDALDRWLTDEAMASLRPQAPKQVDTVRRRRRIVQPYSTGPGAA